MTLHLSGEVNYAMLDNLVKAYNSLKEDEKLYIYLTSPEGGLVDVAEAIVDFINLDKETIAITFYGEVFSSGMHIFLKTECPKLILRDTRGMYHFSWQEMTISEGGKPTGAYDMFSLKEMKRAKNETIAYLKTTKLLDKEINAIKKGQDVYFSYARMLELIS